MAIRGETWQTDAGPVPISGLQFSGSMPGGHGSATFEVPVANAYLAPHHTLYEGAWIEIFDDAHELYEGEIFSIKPSVDASGQHKLSVTCGGLISVAGKRADVSATWVHRGSEGWIRRPGTPSNLGSVTFDNGVIELLVAAGSTQNYNGSSLWTEVAACFVLDSGLSDDTISYVGMGATYNVLNEPTLGQTWQWVLYTAPHLAGTYTASAFYPSNYAETWAADYTPPAGTKALMLLLLCWIGAHTVEADRYLTVTKMDIFSGGRTTKPRIDEAMVALATRTGLATSSVSEAVGGMLDDLRVGNGTAKTSAAGGMATIAGLYAQPFEWAFWDERSFVCKPQPEVPDNDARVIVVGGGLPGLESWDVAEYDEDVPDYACVLFANKDDPNYPEGWPRRMYRPETPADDADLKVEVVDFSGLILADDVAAAAGDNIVTSGGSLMPSTGGTVTYDGAYTVHTFTASGSLHLPGTASASAEVLVVGGGGGGCCGGGGGGGYVTSTQTVSGTMAVTVGAGGSGGYNGGVAETNVLGGNGGSSSFGTSTAAGGGAGGITDDNGIAGGCGGGGGGSLSGTNIGGAASAGYGGGGNAGYAGAAPSGGGGGAGAVGANASSTTVAGAGGAGLDNDIVVTGVNVGYGGGGGGACLGTGTPGTATHGGGAGGAYETAGSAGTDGRGGGGGAAGSGKTGGKGGSGIVVVRYATLSASEAPPARSLAKGTVVISGTVRNRQGAVVPAHHVRAGWWIQHTETGSTDPLYITGHSVDLAGKKNALTIGVDWMEKEIGVRQAELLAIPPTVVPDPVTDDYNDPYTPDVPYEETEPYDEPYVDPGEPQPEPEPTVVEREITDPERRAHDDTAPHPFKFYPE